MDTRTRPHAAAKSEMAAALLFAKPLPLAAAIEPEHAGGLPAQPGFYVWWIERGTIPGVPHHPHPTRSLLGLLYVGIRPTRATSERGTHDELMADPEGLYARLYVEQFSRDGDQRPPYDDRRADVPL